MTSIPDLRNTMCKGRDINECGMFQKQVAPRDWNIGYRRSDDLQGCRDK